MSPTDTQTLDAIAADYWTALMGRYPTWATSVSIHVHDSRLEDLRPEALTAWQLQLEAFRTRINEVARRSLKREDLQAPLRLDAEVRLTQISMNGMADLARLHPVGQENPPVQFFARNLTHARPLQRVGKDRQHVKLWVTDGEITHECVWWNAGEGALPVIR